MSAMLQEIGIREEYGVVQESLRVDRTGSRPIVRGVKLVGLTSKNRREYPAQTLREASPLYEGAKINDDHPKGQATQARGYSERMGNVLKGSVNFREGSGLYGDVSINPKHALAEQFLDDAEHAPENVALSHNILGKITYRGDIAVVEKITRVISVDVVGDPGSTNGLFESEDFDAMKTVKKTFRVLLAEARPQMVSAFESIAVANGISMETAHDVQEGAKPDEQLAAVFESLGIVAMRENKFDSMRVFGLLAKDLRENVAPVAEKYNAKGSVAGGGGTNADGSPSSGVPNGGGAVTEALTKILERLDSQDRRFAAMEADKQKAGMARAALRESAVVETPELLEKLCAMGNQAEMKLHLLTRNAGASHGQNGEFMEARQPAAVVDASSYKPPENAKGFAGRFVSR